METHENFPNPQWDANGEPMNLEAAAIDAHTWLRFFLKELEKGNVIFSIHHSEDMIKLSNAISAIEKFCKIA